MTETVSITSEVTPVQVADSSRRSTLTIDDIANIQTKGRDIFGLLAILPGVQDTNLNRDFAQWRSAISVTINGMPSQNKDVRVDGINIVDEGGCGTAYVNLNMDAVGEVQVIANGYTAENGRNNGGVISMVTKSGTNQLRASGWLQRPPRQVQRERLFPRGDQPGRSRSTASTSPATASADRWSSRADRQPEVGGKKFYFFGSQEYTDDARPTTTTPREHADGARVQRRLLADRGSPTRHASSRSSTRSPASRSRATSFRPQAQPACGIAFSCMDPLGQRMLRHASRGERHPRPARRSSSGRRTRPTT